MTMRPKRTIFVSYASADVDVALRLQQWLLQCGRHSIDVFLAADDMSLPAGKEWFPALAAALAQADRLIVLVSESAIRSSWVAFEAGFVSALGRPVIPILLPPFGAARLKPPLAFRQWIELTTPLSLPRILKAVNLRPRHTFEATSYRAAYNGMVAACAGRRKGSGVDAVFLNSRKDLYAEIMHLLTASDGPIHVRATSTLRDRDAAGDEVFQQYVRTLARRCAEAPDLSRFTLAMSFPGKTGEMPPRDRRRAIRYRQREFREAGAERCLTILQVPTYWTLDVMTIGYDHALIGVPVAPDDPHLRGAVRVSNPSLVATLADWFDECVKQPARLIDPLTLRIR